MFIVNENKNGSTNVTQHTQLFYPPFLPFSSGYLPLQPRGLAHCSKDILGHFIILHLCTCCSFCTCHSNPSLTANSSRRLLSLSGRIKGSLVWSSPKCSYLSPVHCYDLYSCLCPFWVLSASRSYAQLPSKSMVPDRVVGTQWRQHKNAKDRLE